MDINELIESCYLNEKNYLIRRNDTNNGLCYIYFSSNALYKKEDPNDFSEKIIRNNRYEWLNLSSAIKPCVEIFVRDVYLSWYVKGINNEVCSYEKLIELLQNLTKGYTVRCVGASSGGFIGNIVAMGIEAECCYCFAGQFSLRHHFDHLQKNPLLHSYLEEFGDFWFEYYSRLEDYDGLIIYICPNHSEQDIEQRKLIEKYKNVRIISVKSEQHGVALYSFAVPKFISCIPPKSKSYQSKLHISLRYGGIRRFISYMLAKKK